METIGVIILLFGAQVVLTIMFVMCMRFSTRQAARVNESKVIPPVSKMTHHRILFHPLRTVGNV